MRVGIDFLNATFITQRDEQSAPIVETNTFSAALLSAQCCPLPLPCLRRESITHRPAWCLRDQTSWRWEPTTKHWRSKCCSVERTW
jgi:hypothetical protein